MEERFGLLFVILDRAYLAQVRRDRGFGVNPWRTHSRFLVSHNLLIDLAYADPMREWLGDLSPGSLLILDEAHHAAPSSGGRYGIETKFTRAIRDLGGRFEHRLFLSATPHNGNSERCPGLLDRSRRWVDFESEPFRAALSCSLELLGAEPLLEERDGGGSPTWTFPTLAGQTLADGSWNATLDTLRVPRKRAQKLAEWRREAPIRPVVFEDAGVLTDDTVHLHLEQRMAQRLLARFRAQGFVHHDLSRACLVQAGDSIPRVILLGRVCLYGRRAERLHEILTPVAARWIEPSRRTGPLSAYAGEAEARTLHGLESALEHARAPSETVHRRLLDTAAQDISDLVPQLEERAKAVARAATDALRSRGESEARQLRATLERQRERVEAELIRHEASQDQLTLGLNSEEERQRQADVAAWRRRLTHFDRDLETEPSRIRAFYQVRTQRVEPVGFVYLWPDTG